jgi:nitroimidazol reductase NimA-like FMN-containing flavoprotein (pyridoxamine 5'-phosphate oxidase superfamily)
MVRDAGPMTTWHDTAAAAPELTAMVQARFEATGLGLLATLRADGSPRISGVEPWIWDGELWMGMMHDSRKALDLRRDPRFALHAATVDKEVKEGDARVSGRAVEIDDGGRKTAVATALHERSGMDVESLGPWHLFRADISELVVVRPGGDHLVITSWRPGEEVRRVERR